MESERILSEFNWALSFNRTNVEGPLKDSDQVRVTLKASEWWKTHARLFITMGNLSGEIILSAATLGRKWKNSCSCRTKYKDQWTSFWSCQRLPALLIFFIRKLNVGRERTEHQSTYTERIAWPGVSLKPRRQMFPIMFAVLLFCCPGD